MNNLHDEDILAFEKKISSSHQKLKSFGILLISAWFLVFGIFQLSESTDEADMYSPINSLPSQSLVNRLVNRIDSLSNLNEKLTAENQELRSTNLALESEIQQLNTALRRTLK